jgi:hypothetical protein
LVIADQMTGRGTRMVEHVTTRRWVKPHFRPEASPPPLSDRDAAVWERLRPLMLNGPDRPFAVQGTIVSTADGDPVTTRAWLDGGRVRLERLDGSPVLIMGDSATWRFGGESLEFRTLVAPRRETDSWYEARIAFRRSETEADVFGFGEPVGPFAVVEHLGRPAWRFAFWPPRDKPAPMHVVVDAATGLVLRQHFADPARRIAWTELAEVASVPSDRFTWSGPVVTQDEIQAEQEAEHARDMDERARWFHEHVTPTPLDIRGPVSVLVNSRSTSGRFSATLSGPFDGSIARRPRTATRWRTGMASVDHSWTDERWDWALQVWSGALSADEVAELQRQLGTRPSS